MVDIHCSRLCELYTAQNVIDEGLIIIRKYIWLLDSYVLDYYTDSHWKKIPKHWLGTLTCIDLPELSQFVDVQSTLKYSRVWPLSMLTLRVLVARFAIPRLKVEERLYRNIWANICCDMSASSALDQRAATINPCEQFERNCSEFCLNGILNSEKLTISNEQDDVNICQKCSRFVGPSCSKIRLNTMPYMTHPKLRNLFNKHVNPKKRHEISKFAQVTAETAQRSGCSFILDVGSGRGHLARLLAYGYGLRVCCLEAQTALVNEAERFDLELEKTGSKHLKPEEVGQCYRPVHLNFTLNYDTAPHQISEGLKTAFGKSFDEDLSFGIVGLHPCGDLAPILLRLFNLCPGATFINIVGCCFMKLSTSCCSSTQFFGYPMSGYLLTKTESCELNYLLRELSCHALETYCERLQEGKFSDLKVHCYRATLEEIILKNWPHLRHSAIKSVKYSNEMTFSEYCDAALSKLAIKVPLEDITSKKTLQNLLEWKQVVIFYTLRLWLAPLVETVILLDRLLYLREHGISSTLVPVFDPKVSPRNHVLIGSKSHNS